jgi:hypothetical protein
MSEELRASIFKYVDDALQERLRVFGLYVHGVEVTQAIGCSRCGIRDFR